MKSYQAPEVGKPLIEVESQTPEPTGSQVIIKTIACGVCHSDVHIHSGAFDLVAAMNCLFLFPIHLHWDMRSLEKS